MTEDIELRDKKGKFTVGHPLLNTRDKTTGKFTVNPRIEPEIVLKITKEPKVEPPKEPVPEPVVEKPDPIIKNPRTTFLKKPRWY